VFYIAFLAKPAEEIVSINPDKFNKIQNTLKEYLNSSEEVEEEKLPEIVKNCKSKFNF
jgi:hypothetical protein